MVKDSVRFVFSFVYISCTGLQGILFLLFLPVPVCMTAKEYVLAPIILLSWTVVAEVKCSFGYLVLLISLNGDLFE